jgi:hypothetical protein
MQPKGVVKQVGMEFIAFFGTIEKKNSKIILNPF